MVVAQNGDTDTSRNLGEDRETNLAGNFFLKFLHPIRCYAMYYDHLDARI